MVVLMRGSEGRPSLLPDTICELGELGVTNVAVVRDADTVGIVLEGWSLDPARATDAAAVVAGDAAGVRTLLPLAEMALRSQEEEHE